jgi:flavin reductase (DIM6/NTAB) family NADH-FMN oxidoreductase RutF
MTTTDNPSDNDARDDARPMILNLPEHGIHQAIKPNMLSFGGALTLVSTLAADGSPVVRPFSACFAVGDSLLLGLNGTSTTRSTLESQGECVVNVPQADLAVSLEAYAKASKQAQADGFAVMGITAVPSETVCAPRVRECYLQLESRLVTCHRSPERDDAVWAELAVTRVHAVADIVQPGTDRIDADIWRPLVYSFRRYFTLGDAVG